MTAPEVPLHWLILSLLGCTPTAAPPAITDLGPGSVALPEGFTNVHTGTTDSTMGTLSASDGHLVVSYDIGAMAGTHATAAMTSCGTFETLDAGGVPAFVCTTSAEGPRQVVATVGSATHAGSHFPANFHATVDDDAERDAVIGIVTSYRPASLTQTRLLYVPRGIEAVSDDGGSRLALSMEADPTAVEVTTGASLGYSATWTLVEGGVRKQVFTRRVCGAQLPSDVGPPDPREGAVYEVEVVVFETKVACTDPWSPETDGYRELHRATID